MMIRKKEFADKSSSSVPVEGENENQPRMSERRENGGK